MHRPAPYFALFPASAPILIRPGRKAGVAAYENSWPVSIVVAVQAPAPPVGLVEVTTRPASSSAAQSEVEGHGSITVAPPDRHRDR